MAEFFLELFSEEIPARMQAQAVRSLSIISTGVLQDIVLPGTPVTEFYGPRRIAVGFEVQPKVVAVHNAQRGPRADAPPQAVEGFLRKNNASRDGLRVEDGYFILTTSTPERTAQDVIVEKLPSALAKLPWPKSMRWGSGGEFTWVRPLRRIVCLLDGEVVPVMLGPVTAGNVTEGHRVHGKGPFEVSSAAVWEEKLREHRVIANPAERRARVAEGIAAEAAKLGLTVAPDEALLDEVTGLAEWPVPLIGKIDNEFMELPPEVRELSMKINQKYFALRDETGAPAPYFAFVANLAADDEGKAIIAGNERVLRARLSDARHFWTLDLKTRLDELLPKLEKITFHAKIGTQRQRADRIGALAKEIAEQLGADGYESKQAETAGLLAKADLVTGMVGEFPELQGIMGGYYAERSYHGWDGPLVGQAIRAHYQPKGPSDAVPSGIVAVSVALADKLDTLREFFAVGEKPTGSGDPFALRRAALGVIRTVLENGIRLTLKPLLKRPVDDTELLPFGEGQPVEVAPKYVDELFNFIIERLRVKLRGEGKRFDVLDAVLAAGEDDDLARIMMRVEALSNMLNTMDGTNLLTAYRRAANILRIENAVDGPHDVSPDPGLFEQEEERTLFQDTAGIVFGCNELLRNEDFEQAMTMLAAIRPAIDAFFENVTVNADAPDLRRNRLRLLARFTGAVNQVADFSRIEG